MKRSRLFIVMSGAVVLTLGLAAPALAVYTTIKNEPPVHTEGTPTRLKFEGNINLDFNGTTSSNGTDGDRGMSDLKPVPNYFRKCARERTIQIQRDTTPGQPGGWQTVANGGTVRSDAEGDFVARVPDQPGRYRKVIKREVKNRPGGTVECFREVDAVKDHVHPT
jgi:hypothetical protein